MPDVWARVPTPCYVVDERRLRRNLEILAAVKREASCRILLAQKAFAEYRCYPLIGRYLDGTAASGLHEARLGRERMGGEVHVFAPAFRGEEFDEIASLADHVVFNSLSQWRQFGARARQHGCECGLRVNPEHSTQAVALYDPCAPGSRLGVRAAALAGVDGADLDGITGLHFHTLCEQGAEPLAETLAVVERNFAPLLERVKWVNLGGGHHITKPGYNLPLLVDCVRRLRECWGVDAYLEPGEAVALNAGELVASVLDIVETSTLPVAVLDASAACHMPDVLEMPYRPPLMDSAPPDVKPHAYRLAGPTCLAGDVIGDYSFDAPLAIGQRLVFGDMAIYTMVKNTTFNGINLPGIALVREDGTWSVVRRFGYDDFTARL